MILALLAGAVLLVILGRDPLTFYRDIWENGIQEGTWQDSAMLGAPLLLIGVGLIIIFRANIWNLGYDGQYLLGAVLITGVAPDLQSMPLALEMLLLFLLSIAAAAAWTVVPALLKAISGTNEIITTLMMSFIGIGLANILVKGPFQDPTVNIPQTQVIPLDRMLPSIPGTRVHIGVLVALAAAGIAYYVMTRTSFGLRLHVLGANPRAAEHVGVNVKRLVVQALPDQRRADRTVGRRRHPRCVGLRAGELEPRVRRHRDPVRVPRAPQPARTDPVHRVLRGALDRWRHRRLERRSADRFPARLGGSDPAVHDRHRVLRQARQLGRSYLPPGLKAAFAKPLFGRRPNQKVDG